MKVEFFAVVTRGRGRPDYSQALNEVLTGPAMAVTSASGGVVLGSGEVKSLMVKSLPENDGDIFVGGVEDRPYSGFGFVISPGEVDMKDVSNLNRVFLCAQTSGDLVCYEGLEV